MRIYANWKLAMSMLVGFCLLMMQVEPGAFAKAQESSPAVSATARQVPAPQPGVPQSSQNQTQPQSGHRRLKWLLTAVAAVGGVVTVILLTKKKAEPVITVGGPTVGNPQ